ncbi:hypothetical protein pipiens_003957 [Culex pipiens pipiens]|uniref:Gustatory receptor n=1 Tax=Culex pipiens pipiens TaxID=38569 RepID=A0ABD1CQ84_CULPP
MARKLVQDRLFRRRTNKVTSGHPARTGFGTAHSTTPSGASWQRPNCLPSCPCVALRPRIPRRLHFSWFSKRALYTYVGLAGTAFLAMNAIIRFLMKNFNFNRLTTVFFYSYNLYGMYRFLLLARKWPKLMQSWYDAEQTLPQLGNVVDRGALAWKIKLISSHPTFVHTVYFWLGLIFLIGRTLAVSMYAAEVNDESKRPIEVLRTIPRDGWCLEAKRFAEEVVNDTVALTGMKFFNMTRKLVLKVTGSIITYELVLIQFHQDEPVEVNLCKMKRF